MKKYVKEEKISVGVTERKKLPNFQKLYLHKRLDQLIQ